MDCELLMEVGLYRPQIVTDPKLPLDECSFGVTGTYDGTRQAGTVFAVYFCNGFCPLICVIQG